MPKISFFQSAKNSGSNTDVRMPIGQMSRAFTLLELIIVVLILSLISLLLATTMQKTGQKQKPLTPENLKAMIGELGLLHTEGELFCLDACRQCYLYKDGKTTKYEGAVALGEMEVYRLDSEEKLSKIDFGRYDDHPVCLRFAFHANGSSSQMVIQNRSNSYFIPAFFGDVIKFSSLEEVEEYWATQVKSLKDQGEYY